MIDLTTKYMGLTLKNPDSVLVGITLLSKRVSTIKAMEDAGVAAVTMYSLFEEQDPHRSAFTAPRCRSNRPSSLPRLRRIFPRLVITSVGLIGYLEQIRKAKEAIDIPVIGVNGVTTGGWTRYREKLIEEAGADALELTFYLIPTRLNLSSDGVGNPTWRSCARSRPT